MSASCIATMLPPGSRAPFRRGRMIVRTAGSQILQLRDWPSDDPSEAARLSAEDLGALLLTQHAWRLPLGVEWFPGAAVWWLCPTLVRFDDMRRDLSMSGAMPYVPLTGYGGPFVAVVNESHPDATILRTRWRSEALTSAVRLAGLRSWAGVELEAQQAFAVAPGLDAESAAWLAFAHARCGRTVRADGILTMVGRSRGSLVLDEVRRQIAQLQQTCPEETP